MLLYSLVWYGVYLLDAGFFAMALFLDDDWPVHVRSYPGVVLLTICYLMGNIVITDTCTDWLCILLAKAVPDKATAVMEDNAVADRPELKFLVVYCLKSSSPEDMKETLLFLKASWRMNTDYRNVVYCVLSGTQAPALVDAEKNAVAEFNATGLGPTVRYVRRTRTVLHKYGQYLDFLMLLNGHKEVKLYEDVQTESGLVFDPATDVDFFCGSNFEYITIMDRDNVLSANFFTKASMVFTEDLTVQIVQPQIKPFPKNFRRALHGGESVYTSLTGKFQIIGNEVQELKKKHVPVAPFFGKGVIRRSAYNETLLEYDSGTGKTKEAANVPRDLLSHDLIESCVMKTSYRSDMGIYEDFPLTLVEWAQPQNRWDLGDLVIGKYVYPLSFGLLPNLLSRFKYARSIFKYCFEGDAVMKYNSTFNIRAAFVKPWVVAGIVAAYFLTERVDVAKTLAFLAFVNLQMIVLPTIAVLLIVRGISWRERLAVQLFTVYFGTIDIWYGAWRAVWAFGKILTGSNKWNTYGALGHSSLRTMLVYVRVVAVELAIAALLFGAVVYDGVANGFDTRQIMAVVYLGLVLTFPGYAYVSSMKRGKFDLLEKKTAITAVSSTNSIKSTKETETEDALMEIALAEILSDKKMEKLDEIQANARAQERALFEVKSQAFRKAHELDLIAEDQAHIVVDCPIYEDDGYLPPVGNVLKRMSV